MERNKSIEQYLLLDKYKGLQLTDSESLLGDDEECSECAFIFSKAILEFSNKDGYLVIAEVVGNSGRLENKSYAVLRGGCWLASHTPFDTHRSRQTLHGWQLADGSCS